MAITDSLGIKNTKRSTQVSRMFLGFDLHGWEHWMLACLVVAALGGIGGVVATYAVVKLQRSETAQAKTELEEYKADAANRIAAANATAALATERAAEAELKTEETKRLTALIDKDLLDERRLTARERWLMERVTRAVLPRRISPEVRSHLVRKLQGLGTINVAIVDKREPRQFGMEIVQLFQEAGILGKIFQLPSQPKLWGVTTYSPKLEESKIAEVLWRDAQIGGSMIGILAPDLRILPEDELCLIVGENDAAFQSMNGQPGEGVDENNRPVPAPR